MKKSSGPCKLAHGAFGCSLFGFLGPGFYFTLNAHAPQAQVVVEAGLLGAIETIMNDRRKARIDTRHRSLVAGRRVAKAINGGPGGVLRH